MGSNHRRTIRHKNVQLTELRHAVFKALLERLLVINVHRCCEDLDRLLGVGRGLFNGRLRLIQFLTKLGDKIRLVSINMGQLKSIQVSSAEKMCHKASSTYGLGPTDEEEIHTVGSKFFSYGSANTWGNGVANVRYLFESAKNHDIKQAVAPIVPLPAPEIQALSPVKS